MNFEICQKDLQGNITKRVEIITPFENYSPFNYETKEEDFPVIGGNKSIKVIHITGEKGAITGDVLITDFPVLKSMEHSICYFHDTEKEYRVRLTKLSRNNAEKTDYYYVGLELEVF